jgi:simple sugar transport system substrate-binding protein
MRKVDPKVDEAIQTLNLQDSPTRRKLLAGTGLVGATAAASALLAACSSNSSTAAASNGKNPFPTVPNQKYYFVNHADTNEYF